MKIWWFIVNGAREIWCFVVGHVPEPLGVICLRCNKTLRNGDEVTMKPVAAYKRGIAHQHIVGGLQAREDRQKRKGCGTWYRDIHDQYVAILAMLEYYDKIPPPPYFPYENCWHESAWRAYRNRIIESREKAREYGE